MRIRKTKEQYIEYLNSRYTKQEALAETEHIWKGSGWTKSQQTRAKAMVNHGCVGQCIKTYDPQAFEYGYKKWSTDIKNLEL